MKKFYCDCCGKEIRDLGGTRCIETKVNVVPDIPSEEVLSVIIDLCGDCAQKLHKALLEIKGNREQNENL